VQDLGLRRSLDVGALADDRRFEPSALVVDIGRGVRTTTKEQQMPQYLILIYESEQSFADAGQPAWDLAMQEHNAFGERDGASLRGGNALQGTSTATSIRGDGSGGFSVTDGPFAETKEALGGYYLVEADDLDGAIEIAKHVPARHGGVEVRPIMTFE
jgi:hypothetical protein